MNFQEYEKNKVQEKNIVSKTIAAILAAAVISAFSISSAYVLVTELQPAAMSEVHATAARCGESDGDDKPKAAVNTCGEDKKGEGDGGNSINV